MIYDLEAQPVTGIVSIKFNKPFPNPNPNPQEPILNVRVRGIPHIGIVIQIKMVC
jgi:hypothetical protein